MRNLQAIGHGSIAIRSVNVYTPNRRAEESTRIVEVQMTNDC